MAVPSADWTCTTRHGAALLGCAVGDCVGLPFENREPPPAGWTARLGSAQCAWSDDTQQSLVVLDDFLRNGSVDAHRVMDTFVAYDAERLHRGTGRGFRAVVEAYARHHEFRPDPERAGNGAAMRVAPVALAMPATEASLRQLLRLSRATHSHVDALHAAEAVIRCAWLLREAGAGTGTSALLERLATELPEGRVRQVLGEVARGADRVARLPALTGWSAGDGHALGSPLTAVVVAVEGADFLGVVTRAVCIGRETGTSPSDTDTLGAIAGALFAGASGVGSLPSDVLDIAELPSLMAWSAATAPQQRPIDVERRVAGRG